MTFKYCPDCGGECKKFGIKEYRCQKCGHSQWDEPDVGAAVLVHHSDRGYLFGVRGKGANIGKLGLPGGYVDQKETLEAGAARECREEMGITVATADLKYACSQTYQVEVNGIECRGVTAFFTAETTQEGKCDGKEMDKLVWLKKEEIDPEKIGPEDCRKFIVWYLSLSPNKKLRK